MPYKDKDRDKQYKKEYYHKNKERLKKYNKDHNKEYYQKNKEVIKRKKREYKQNNKEYIEERRCKKTYNLTFEEIDQILITQNHKCLICGKSLMETKRCIDHDHKTGKIRGILCDMCNTGLGHFYDNPEFLRKTVLYIENK